jgi:ribosome maturation factor RimP
MSNETLIQLDKMVAEVLKDAPEHFLVSLLIKPTHNIKLLIDGDAGITIEQCVRFNRRLVPMIDEAGIFPPGEYSLEVSSPGVDEPLKLHRQYVKNIGRTVQAQLTNQTTLTGVLKAVTDESITLEYTEGKGKKAVVHQTNIPFTELHSVTVQIIF